MQFYSSNVKMQELNSATPAILETAWNLMTWPPLFIHCLFVPFFLPSLLFRHSSDVMMHVLLTLVFVVLLTSFPSPITARLREGECEVCLKRVGDFISELSTIKDETAVENGIKRICKTYTDKADKRFCYYIGGSEDAATSLLRTLSRPIINHMPKELICDRLKSADGQICAVHYEKPPTPIDWSAVDLTKMRVKELKHILDGWQEKCEGCTEKGDFIRMINAVKDKHIGGAAASKDL